jgi:hypothetical protein
VAWSDDVYKHSVEVNVPGAASFQLHDVSLEIYERAQEKLRVRLSHGALSFILQLRVDKARIVFTPETDLSQITVTRKGETFAFLTYLRENHFHLYLSDFSRISGASLFCSNAGDQTAFSVDCIVTNDWKAENVSKRLRGGSDTNKRPTFVAISANATACRSKNGVLLSNSTRAQEGIGIHLVHEGPHPGA